MQAGVLLTRLSLPLAIHRPNWYHYYAIKNIEVLICQTNSAIQQDAGSAGFQRSL